jgi:hypothetical protein
LCHPIEHEVAATRASIPERVFGYGVAIRIACGKQTGGGNRALALAQLDIRDRLDRRKCLRAIGTTTRSLRNWVRSAKNLI